MAYNWNTVGEAAAAQLPAEPLPFSAPEADTEGTIGPVDLLKIFEGDFSTWFDIRHYPASLTLRRMIRLANFAADYPERWRTILAHYAAPNLTYRELGETLGISAMTVSRHLQPINLAEPEDFREDVDEDFIEGEW